MTVSVRCAKEADFQNLTAWLQARPDARPFHLPAWSIAAGRVTGQAPALLIAEDSGALAGVLPLGFRRSWLFGQAALSAPFAVDAGPVATRPDIAAMLIDAAWTQAQARGFPELVLRMRYDIWDAFAAHLEEPAAWDVQSHSVTFAMPLAATDADRLKAVPRKQRAVVRKAMGQDFQVQVGADQLDILYRLYAMSVHRLGTPVFPKALFDALVKALGDHIDIAVVYGSDGTPLTALMSFFWGDRVMPYYIGSTKSARVQHASNFIYFDLMARAAERGCTVFDWGKSRNDSGPFHYKKNWGATHAPLVEVTQTRGGKTPGAQTDPARYGLQQTVWKHLPLPLANLIGPHLARHLG